MPIHQFVNIFGTQTPLYGLCAGLGLIVIGVRLLIGFREFSMNCDHQNELLYGFPFMVICGVIFALLLDATFTSDWHTWTSNHIRRFGFTYTGWLFGIIPFLSIYGRYTSFGPRFCLNFFLPSLALSQAFGR
ncbi:MAG: prolipoprotein diacylglyceryl transferase, partial [Proteobacteria bacterium]|nr:prolipoprotein diacylglyceryl transferase [Pseudomonadota bacterium]